MYEIFEQLLQKNGITAYKVSKETGIATATLTDWKKGRSIPKQDKLQKIADYFNVNVEYLTTGEKSKNNNIKLSSDEINLLKEYQNLTIDKKEEFKRLMDYYTRLNDIGVKKVIENASDLSRIYGGVKELRAAHNDNINDIEEIEKMNQDLDDLKD